LSHAAINGSMNARPSVTSRNAGASCTISGTGAIARATVS